MELTHYGVLGMKWGKRKSRVESRSNRTNKAENEQITKAKSKVNTAQTNYKNAATKFNREAAYSQPSPKTVKALNDAKRELEYAKDDLSSAKILNKLSKKTKSSAQLKAEEKYKQKGMSDDEAAVAAYKNVRTKQILTGLAVAGASAGVAYGVAKYRNENVDKIIKSGKVFQHVSSDSTASVRDAFYSTDNPLDKIKYKGLFGTQLSGNGDNVYAKQVKTLHDIKQISPKNAKKELTDLLNKDAGFKESVANVVNKNLSPMDANFGGKRDKILNAIQQSKVDKDVYEVFNTYLVDHSPQGQQVSDRFYKTLSEKGYNAIKDVNDAKYSGYKSINPIITFNSSGKVSVTDVKELTKKQIADNKDIAYAAIAGGDLVKSGASFVAAIVGGKAISKSLTNKQRSNMVEQYRKENPNTNKSYNEIVRMLERSA